MIEPILIELKETLRLKDENFYNIMIAVTEAVNNAVTHGNQLDPSKEVTFQVIGEPDYITITVKDSGKGFDPNTVEDCLEPDNLLKESGRGVFIIKELMDDVKIESDCKGTTLTMRYRIK